MKILVACPSKARSETISKNTLKFIQNDYFSFDFKVFVEPQDHTKYRNQTDQLIVLADNDQGLAYVKKTIQQYAINNKYDYVFKIDDDVNNIRLPELIGSKKNKIIIDKSQLFQKRVEALNLLIEDSLELFEEYNNTIGAVSLMYGSDFHAYTGQTWLSFNNRLQSNYIIKTSLLCNDIQAMCYEDFVTFLNVLANDYNTIRYGLTALEVEPVGKNAGGVQSFNRNKQSLVEMKLIQQKYPEVIWKKVEGKGWDYEPDFRATKSIKTMKI